MQTRLIGYLLGALEIEDSTDVEQALKADTEVRRQLELLRGALAPLDGDREDVEAPNGLAIRTCEQIRAVARLRSQPNS